MASCRVTCPVGCSCRRLRQACRQSRTLASSEKRPPGKSASGSTRRSGGTDVRAGEQPRRRGPKIRGKTAPSGLGAPVAAGCAGTRARAPRHPRHPRGARRWRTCECPGAAAVACSTGEEAAHTGRPRRGLRRHPDRSVNDCRIPTQPVIHSEHDKPLNSQRARTQQPFLWARQIQNAHGQCFEP